MESGPMNTIHFKALWEDAGYVWPLVVVLLTAVLVFLVDLVRGRRARGAVFFLTLLGLGCALVYDLVLLLGRVHLPPTLFSGLVAPDPFALVFNALVYLSAFLCVLLSHTYLQRSNTPPAAFYGLLLFVVSGMNTMALSGDLMVLFLGVELLSIPLYVLAAFLRDRRTSIEAGFKYFLLGAFASAFLLYGIVLLYGATGTTLIPKMVTVISRGGASGLVLCGLALTAVGFAFKVAAVPFHMWAPDVYEGAPTPITAFMATAVKVAGFAAILRVFAHVAAASPEAVGSLLASGAAVLAALTMVVGNLGALPQRNIKRMLAYSSVAHAGYLLVGVAAGLAVNDAEAYRAVAFYLAAYTFMNIGAFAMVIFLHHRGGECNDIEHMAGRARRFPGMALAMAIFMFTLAGLPPSAGFFGKFYLFKAAVNAGMIKLAVLGVLMSVVSLFYYLRVVTTLYLKSAPEGDKPELTPCPYLAVAALCSVAGVLLMGVFPPYFMDLLGRIF